MQRKRQNLEIERKKRLQRKMYLGVFSAICLVVVIIIAWVVWDTQNRRWIMTFNGERVATSDFRFMAFLNQQQIDDSTRHSILFELKSYLAVLQAGERHGVGYTLEELAELTEEARQSRIMFEQGHTGMLGFIGDRRMGELLGAFERVGSRLTDLLIEYEPDEEEFEEMFEEVVQQEMEAGRQVMIKYMATEDRHGFDEVHAQEFLLVEDFDFDAIAARHCVLGTGLEPISLDDFITEHSILSERWEMDTVSIGDVSQLIEGMEHYFIIYVVEHVDPELDLEELRIEFREALITQRSRAIFMDMVTDWVDESVYELNRRVYDNIT